MGELMFKKVQYVKEATKGTIIPATKRWLGTASIPKDRTLQHPEYTLGQRARSGHTAINQIFADPVNLSCKEGYFQALPLIFGIGLTGGLTPTELHSGKLDYSWAFGPSMTALAAPDSATIEIGDDTQAYVIEYLMSRRITIAGSLGDDSYVSIDAECFGRQVAKQAFTAAIALPTSIEPMIANTAKIWIDTNWAGLGGTLKTSCLREFSVEILTGIHPKWFGASKLFTIYGESYVDVAANFVFEGNADGVAILDAYQAGTPKAIRLSILGALTATGGTAHTCQIDMYGTFDEVIPLSGDKEGNNLYRAVFTGLSDLQSTPHELAVMVITDIGTY